MRLSMRACMIVRERVCAHLCVGVCVCVCVCRKSAGAASAARNTFAKNANCYHPICRKMVQQDFKSLKSSSGILGISTGGWMAMGVVGYLAWAVMRVRANKCPVPFVH